MKRVRIKKDELVSLFARNPDLKQEVHPNFIGPVIFLPDDKVLVTTWDGAIECDNYEEAFKVFGRPRKEDDPIRLNNLIPDPRVFIRDIDKVYRQFNGVLSTDAISVPLEEMSAKDLAKVDVLVSRRGAKSFFQPMSFQYLVVCIGEAFRLSTHGEWGVLSTKDDYGDPIDVPIVIADNGYCADTLGLIRKMLLEWESGCDGMSAVYHAEMRSYIRHDERRK